MPATTGAPDPTNPKRARKPRTAAPGLGSSTAGPTTVLAPSSVEQVHENVEGLATIELSPPHPPRETTPEYARAHHFLVYEKKDPCEVCGVTVDTLATPAANPFAAKALETHHWPIERSLADACDPVKVHRDFPVVYDRATLMVFVDSPANLKVLCDIHHRSLAHGIHHLAVADFAVQKYLLDGYIVAASAKDAQAAIATDEKIEQAAGIEQEVVQEMTAETTKPKRTRKPRTSAKKAAPQGAAA